MSVRSWEGDAYIVARRLGFPAGASVWPRSRATRMDSRPRPVWRRWWQVVRTAARFPASAGRALARGRGRRPSRGSRPGPGRSVRRRGSARRRGGRGSTPRPTRGRGARRRAALVVELGEDDEALRPDGGYRQSRAPDRRFGQRPDLPHPPCRKRSFATHADRLRPRLEARRLPSRWTCSATPCGPRASTTRPTFYPRPCLRRPRRPAGTRQLPARSAEGRRARGLGSSTGLVTTVQDLSARGVGLRVLAGRGRRSTPQLRPADSCSGSSRRWPSSSGS